MFVPFSDTEIYNYTFNHNVQTSSKQLASSWGDNNSDEVYFSRDGTVIKALDN